MENNKTTCDFIGNLDFEYVTTHSFQRGQLMADLEANIQKEVNKKKTDFREKNKGTRIKSSMLSSLFDNRVNKFPFLLDKNGNFHQTNETTHTFNHNTPQFQRFKTILLTPVRENLAFMCFPVYRDALVFYDKNNKIVEVLNICLSCCYMQLKNGNYLDADISVYELLSTFFIDLGHKIEEDKYERD